MAPGLEGEQSSDHARGRVVEDVGDPKSSWRVSTRRTKKHCPGPLRLNGVGTMVARRKRTECENEVGPQLVSRGADMEAGLRPERGRWAGAKPIISQSTLSQERQSGHCSPATTQRSALQQQLPAEAKVASRFNVEKWVGVGETLEQVHPQEKRPIPKTSLGKPNTVLRGIGIIRNASNASTSGTTRRTSGIVPEHGLSRQASTDPREVADAVVSGDRAPHKDSRQSTVPRTFSTRTRVESSPREVINLRDLRALSLKGLSELSRRNEARIRNSRVRLERPAGQVNTVRTGTTPRSSVGMGASRELNHEVGSVGSIGSDQLPGGYPLNVNSADSALPYYSRGACWSAAMELFFEDEENGASSVDHAGDASQPAIQHARDINSADSYLPGHMRPLAVQREGGLPSYCHLYALKQQALLLDKFKKEHSARSARPQQLPRVPEETTGSVSSGQENSMSRHPGINTRQCVVAAKPNTVDKHITRVQERRLDTSRVTSSLEVRQPQPRRPAVNEVKPPDRPPPVPKSNGNRGTACEPALPGQQKQGTPPKSHEPRGPRFAPKPQMGIHSAEPQVLTLWSIILHYLSMIFMDYPAKAHRRWLREMAQEGRLPLSMKLPGESVVSTKPPQEDEDSDADTVASFGTENFSYAGKRARGSGGYNPRDSSTSGTVYQLNQRLKRRSQPSGSQKREGELFEGVGWRPKSSLQDPASSPGGRERMPVQSVLSLPRSSIRSGFSQLKRPSFILTRFGWGKKEQVADGAIMVESTEAREKTDRAQVTARGEISAVDGVTMWGRTNRIRLRRRRSRLARIWDQFRHPMTSLRRKYSKSKFKSRLLLAINKHNSGRFEDSWDRIGTELYIWSQWAFELGTPARVERRLLFFSLAFPFILIITFFFMAGEYPLYLERRGEPIEGYDFGPAQIFKWLVRHDEWRTFDAEFLIEWGARFIPVLPGEGYRWLTSMLIHEDFSHLFTNLILFAILAWGLEGKYGFWRTSFLCIASGLAGNFVSAGGEDPCALVVGASGCVFGLAGFFVIDVLFDFRHVIFPFLRLIGVVVFLVAFAVSLATQTETSHLSHVGGFLTGAGLSFMLLPRFFDERIEATLPWVALTTILIMFLPFPVAVYKDVLPGIWCSLQV